MSDSFNNRDNTGAPIVTGGIQNGQWSRPRPTAARSPPIRFAATTSILFSPTPFTNDLYINFGNQYARRADRRQLRSAHGRWQTGEQVATGNLYTNLNDPLM
ncbi:MAG: hypothetical protein R3C99_25860 [Pirellulaceae bacterium]